MRFAAARRGAQEQTRKSVTRSRYPITERLYTFDGGHAVGARRGGALMLCNDWDSPEVAENGEDWEMFVLDANGVAHGDAVGFVASDVLDRCVARMAAWTVDTRLPEGQHS